jgi:hypothetical protein
VNVGGGNGRQTGGFRLFFSPPLGPLFGADLPGWAVTTSVWTSLSKAPALASKAYAGISGPVSLAATFVFLSAAPGEGVSALGHSAGRFVKAFAAAPGVAYLSWIVGSQAYIAATPDKRAGSGSGGRRI